ncbi:MAG TPA: hypothetical protein VIK38_01035 [Coriobacteriia bacterium]
MTLNRTILGLRGASYPDLLRVLLIIAAVIVVMLVLTAIFGVQQLGPSLEIAPDPASGLGLPF